jgi:hypothetical protein
MENFSNYGEVTTDSYLAKKVEAEVKKLKTTTSAVLQTVTTTFSDSNLLCAVYKFTKTLGVKCSSARISPADSPRP